MAGVGRAWWWVAALLGVAAVVETMVHYATSSAQFVVFAALVAVAMTLPLAIRPPAAAALIIAAAGVLSVGVVGTIPVAGAIAQLGAAYLVGRWGAVPIAVGLGLPYLVVAAFPIAAYPRVLAIIIAVLAPTLALLGVAQRIAQDSRERTATQAALAGTLIEHTARGERARIARELHDVVAHHISMIAVQAESARLTTPGMPPAGAQRLSAIGDTARDALTEMRRLLGVLREDTAPMPVPVRTPQPGLAQLNDLLDEARTASGVGTRLILSGVPLVLDPGVELAAYRIIQEALTNARRHAPGAAVDVELHFGADELEVAVRDNGPGAADAGDPGAVGGHGLLGMSERAIAVGGTLRAGPAAGGGFLVRATLPARGPAVVGGAAYDDPAGGGPSADRPAPAEGAAA
jgi:signal transduction histidine kinase